MKKYIQDLVVNENINYTCKDFDCKNKNKENYYINYDLIHIFHHL